MSDRGTHRLQRPLRAAPPHRQGRHGRGVARARPAARPPRRRSRCSFPEFATDPAFVERFRREATAAANLSHPNIVGVYDWGEAEGTYFIVMEYVNGRTLSQILRADGPLHPDRVADVGADVAAALGFAHRNGVVHRDVKPGNVLVDQHGLVKVADFGIARAITAATDDHLTQVGTVMGTATYFSPEQARGDAVDPRSDLYSLGCVLYELVVGRPPFSGDSPVAIAYKQVHESPVPPRQINPAVPPALEAIILKCLAKEPGQPVPSAEDLRADLRRFREGSRILAEPVMAPPAPPIRRRHRRPGRHHAMAALAVARPARRSAYVDDDYDDEPRRSAAAFLAVLVVLLAPARRDAVPPGPHARPRRRRRRRQRGGACRAWSANAGGRQRTARGPRLRGHRAPTEANDEFEEGVVFEQDPAAARRSTRAATVTLKVSAGAEAHARAAGVVGTHPPGGRGRPPGRGVRRPGGAVHRRGRPEDEVTDQDPPANARRRRASERRHASSCRPARGDRCATWRAGRSARAEHCSSRRPRASRPRAPASRRTVAEGPGDPHGAARRQQPPRGLHDHHRGVERSGRTSTVASTSSASRGERHAVARRPSRFDVDRRRAGDRRRPRRRGPLSQTRPASPDAPVGTVTIVVGTARRTTEPPGRRARDAAPAGRGSCAAGRGRRR